jgi:hypothetical protein
MKRRRRGKLGATGSAPVVPPLASGTNRWGRFTLAVVIALSAGCTSIFGGPEPSGLGSNGITNSCTWGSVKDDCLSTEYCDAVDCKAVGKCVKRPSPFMSGELNWACGCDGITYGNVTFAKAQGVTAPTIGQCTGPGSGGGIAPADPLACSATKNCPVGAVCLPLASSSCSTGAQGYCWAWPNDATCSPGAQIGYLLCNGNTKCMTECEAITSMQRYKMSTIGCR